MATKPKAVTLEATGQEVLNAVRNTASASYQAAVPLADGTVTQLREIGQIITSYAPLRNEFINTMYNMIAYVLITNKMYSNPWAQFKRGIMEFGETVAEYFVSIAKAHGYNPATAENQWMKREIPDVQSAFHPVNYKAMYKQTIQEADLTAAFYSWAGIDQFIAKIVDAMYTADAYDEFNAMKYMIVKAMTLGNMTQVNLTDSSDMTETGAQLKGISNALTFLSTKYNAAGILTRTDKRDQILILNSNFDAKFDSEFLAAAFNLEYAQFLGQRVIVDSFGDIDQDRLSTIMGEANIPFEPLTDDELAAAAEIPGVLVDRDWFMVFDNKIRFEEAFNGEGIYWQYWFHCWKTMSFSPFHNAILFTEGEQTVDTLTVYPSAATLNPGATVQLSATITGSPFVNDQVSWSSNNAEVTVNDTGLVTASASAAGTATITATSIADSTKTGTCAINIATV